MGTIIKNDGKMTLNGVDITDVQRMFSQEEMKKFGKDWPKIQELRRAKRTIDAVYGGTPQPGTDPRNGGQQPTDTTPGNEQQNGRGGRNGLAFGRQE